MADEAKAPGGQRSLTWLWAALALVLMVGFLGWLGVASEPSSVAVVEDTTDEDNAGMPAGSFVEVSKDTLAQNKSRFAGQVVRVDSIEATGTLGPRIFWGELGTRTQQVPILVRLDSAAAQGVQVQQSAYYTLFGMIHPMSDSVATAWGEAGEFEGEGEQMQAAFADYYIQVSNIRPTRGGPPAPAGTTATSPEGGA